MSAENPASILRFWFGERPETAATDPACARLWWSKQAAVDEEMRQRFGVLVEQASRGELDAWGTEPEGRLALILLADQFTRNIHRGTPASFALDPLARRWSASSSAASCRTPVLARRASARRRASGSPSARTAW